MPASRENIDQFVLETVFNDNGAVQGFRILDQEQQKVMQNQDKMKQKTAKLNEEDKKFVKTTNHLSKAFKSLFAVFAVKKMIDYTEQWASIRKTIASLVDDEGRRKQIEDGIYKTALATHQSLEQTSDLYKGIFTATRSLNITDEQRLQLLNNINKALAIGGGSIQENEATVKKLLRALAMGELKPRAIASLIDTAPQLAKMIADGFGVSIEKLRQMAKDGKLTSDKVFKSIMSQTQKVDKEFEKTGVTLREAFTNLSTAISKIIDSDVGGVIGKVAQAINWLANNTWALQTIFAMFVGSYGIKLIRFLYNLRTAFLATRLPIGTLGNALQMIVSGDIIAGFQALVKWVGLFATASWTAVLPWLKLLLVVTSLLLVIDQIISAITGKESVAKQFVYKALDAMTGQNKSARLGQTWAGTGGVKQAVYPTSNSTNTSVRNQFTFNINGAQSPRATGREVERILTTRFRQVGAI